MRECDQEQTNSHFRSPRFGGVPEWSNGVVSKTIVGTAYRGFESLPLRRMPKLLVVPLLGLFLSPPVLGQLTPYVPVIRPSGSHYRVHKTPHFEIIFEEGSEIEAWQASLVLEGKLSQAQALSGIARPMWMPVILNNSSDRSNGYVHTHPFRQEIEVPHIKGNRLGTRSSSWIEAIATHELVHAAQAQAGGARGLGKVMRWFAPDLARTFNMAMPPGLVEGAAIYLESSDKNGAGRLHDARFQMQYRAAAVSENPWSISQLMERSQYGFHPDRHYIGGAHFFAWQRSRDQGFFFERMREIRYRFPIRSTGLDLSRTTEKPLKQLVADFRHETAPQMRVVSQPAHIIAGKRGVVQRWPQWLNDSTLVVYRRGLDETPGLYRIDVKSGKIKLLHAVLLPEDAWFRVSDENTLLYSRYVPDRFSTLQSTADVFEYKISKKREIRLTEEARAHMPIQTSSGVWALRNDGQRNTWVEISGDGNIRTIRERSQADLIQIAPSSNAIAVLVRHGGVQGIYLAEPEGGLKPWIFLEDGTIRELAWSSDGRYLLFAGDADGVTNIYCHDLGTERTLQLTDVPYGALDPLLSDDNHALVYVDYQHERYNVVSTEFRPEDAPAISLMAVEEIPQILPQLEVPADFDHEPYSVKRRLRPRMMLPVAFWPTEYPERKLGFGGGVGLYGSDPLRRITYATELTVQSQKVWGRAEIRSTLGPVMAIFDAYNEPDVVIARIFSYDHFAGEITYGTQSVGTGIRLVLPLRFEANVRHSYARISLGVRSERTRWFNLNGQGLPFRRDTGQSLAEWQSSSRVDVNGVIGFGLQQNRRDLLPNRGTVIGLYTRTDIYREADSRHAGLLVRANQYWSLSRTSSTGLMLGASLLTQNNAGVYSNSLILPRGFEAYLGQGTHIRIDAEILQPVWYIQNGFVKVPVYFKALYLYGFAQNVLFSSDHEGEWAAGLGMGLKFRLLHYLDLEVRASFNPIDMDQGFITLL